MANVDREERKKSLFEKQAMMDKAQKAKAKAEKSNASLLSPKRKVCVRVALPPPGGGSYRKQPPLLLLSRRAQSIPEPCAFAIRQGHVVYNARCIGISMRFSTRSRPRPVFAYLCVQCSTSMVAVPS